MGRPASGIHVRWWGRDGWHDRPGGGRIAYVSFTVNGRRRELSTHCTDATQAGKAAAAIYSREVQRPSRQRRRGGDSFAQVGEQWLDARRTTLAESTQLSYTDALNALSAHFRSTGDVTTESAAEYCRLRLGEITRGTLLIHLVVLRGVMRYAHGDAAPAIGNPPRAPGRHATTPQAFVELSPDEAHAIIDAVLDPRTRLWFRVMYETGLRPATLRLLSVPEHWRRGTLELRITPGINKARKSAALPITPEAAAALAEVAPKRGLIFPGAQRHMVALRNAAVRVIGERGARISNYDLRRMRLTHWGEQSGDLPGIQQLALHSSARTTSRYIKPSFRAAQNVLRVSREYRGAEQQRTHNRA